MRARCNKLLLLVPFLALAPLRADPLPIDQPDSKRKITYAIVGEDATSAHYYFFYNLPGADTLSKVRLLWNGGAQNKPSVTDYYLEDSSILVVERSAAREHLPKLLRGQDAPFTTVSERQIKSLAGESSIGTAEPEHLSKDDRLAVSNLVHALSMIRKPLPKKAL